MTTYTLLSFSKGDDGWRDPCGDYHESDPSELKIDYFSDPKECGFNWALQECDKDTTILLIDGIDPYEASDHDTPEYDARINLLNEAYKYRQEQSDILKSKRNEEQRIKLEKELKEKALAEAKRLAEVEKIELATLKTLLKKYGNDIDILARNANVGAQEVS